MHESAALPKPADLSGNHPKTDMAFLVVKTNVLNVI
jgi:hypothetical protein